MSPHELHILANNLRQEAAKVESGTLIGPALIQIMANALESTANHISRERWSDIERELAE